MKPVQTEKIIKLKKNGKSAAELAELFNVHKATIYRILKN
ncbi:helix-turn-helix domain-containing protein [Kaistella yonginensis]